MRLDHLLSRERAEAEMRKPIPGRSGSKESGKKRENRELNSHGEGQQNNATALGTAVGMREEVLCIVFRVWPGEIGGLAQLGERLPCKQEVSGSIPLISTRVEDRLKRSMEIECFNPVSNPERTLKTEQCDKTQVRQQRGSLIVRLL